MSVPLFSNVSETLQAEYEKEAMQKYDPAIVQASAKKWKSYSLAKKEQIFEEGNRIYQDIVSAMPKGAESFEVQSCIQRWREHIEYFWSPNLQQLLGLVEMYQTDPRFKANFDRFDKNLAEFMGTAVKVYVHQKER